MKGETAQNLLFIIYYLLPVLVHALDLEVILAVLEKRLNKKGSNLNIIYKRDIVIDRFTPDDKSILFADTVFCALCVYNQIKLSVLKIGKDVRRSFFADLVNQLSIDPVLAKKLMRMGC